MFNGAPAAGIGIFQLPDANAITVATGVRAKMDQLAKVFPQGLVYTRPFDTTVFVQASIKEVYVTLIEAGILVLIVIFVFLQDWRAMARAGHHRAGHNHRRLRRHGRARFLVNLSTLFAIVLAIGIVVDDAIVIVEGRVAPYRARYVRPRRRREGDD